MLITRQHGDKLLNNDIIYLINEFDILVDDNNKKMIEHIYDKMAVYTDGRIYNVTDGLNRALRDITLTYSSFDNRIKDIRDNYSFNYKTFFEIFSKLRNNELISLPNCITLIESTYPDILNRAIKNEIEQDCIITLNKVKSDIKMSEVEALLKKLVKDKTVVIVDTVLPEIYINLLYDHSHEIKYIGSYDLFEKNEELFKKHNSERKFSIIEDFGLDEYFNGVVNYIEAHSTNKRLLKYIEYTNDYFIFNEISTNIQIKEMKNLIDHQDSKVIDFKLFPYLFVYVESNALQLPRATNNIFRNFRVNYGFDLLQCLKEWNSIFKNCNVYCVISSLLWEQIGSSTQEKVDDFFVFLDEYSQYQLLDQINQINYLNNILEKTVLENRIYTEIKIIEYIIKKGKFDTFDTIKIEDLQRINLSKRFCQVVLDDSGEMINISVLPDGLQSILQNFKQSYDQEIFFEWMHEDGKDNSNLTAAPFSTSFKKNMFFEEKIQLFRAVRPLISNQVIFFIEGDKASIFDLFSKKTSNYKLTKTESRASFFSYNSNLILTSSGEAFLINKHCEKIDLKITVDELVYNGIRIKDEYVYYFPSPTIFVKSPIEDFIRGEAFFSEDPFYLLDDVTGVIDLLVLNDDVFWITNKTLTHLNLTTRHVTNIVIPEDPRKLFYNQGIVYILFDNSIYSLEEFLKINWVTDIGDWEKFTCTEHLLITAKKNKLTLINLFSSKCQFIESDLIKSDITDIIMTRNRLLVIDNNGRLYDCLILSEGLKNGVLEINEILNITGQKSLIMYSHRYLSINSDRKFYVFSA